MRKLFFAFLLTCINTFAFAQILSPAKWSFTSKKIADKTFEISMAANLDPAWHIYSQDAENLAPTIFTFAKNPLLKLDGVVKEEGKLIKEYDPNIKATTTFYSEKVVFRQIVKIKTTASTIVGGVVTYTVCNNQKCLPTAKIPFSIKL